MGVLAEIGVATTVLRAALCGIALLRTCSIHRHDYAMHQISANGHTVDIFRRFSVYGHFTYQMPASVAEIWRARRVDVEQQSEGRLSIQVVQECGFNPTRGAFFWRLIL